MTAAELAALLDTEIFDVEGAARFLGLRPNSIEYACHRHRIAYVQYGAKKWFTRADLVDYNADRGRGRDSRLSHQPHYVVKPTYVIGPDSDGGVNLGVLLTFGMPVLSLLSETLGA